MKNLLKNTKLLLLLGSIVIAVIMSLVYVLGVMPKPVQGEKDVTLKIVYADNSYEYSLSTDKETVLEVLKEYNDIYDLKLVTKDSPYGEFITSLKGVMQDETNGYYYTYTLNGDYALGVSTQTIKDGDEIEFRYLFTEYDENWNIVGETLKGKGTTDAHVKTAVILFSIAGVILVSGVAYFIVAKIKEKKNG